MRPTIQYEYENVCTHDSALVSQLVEAGVKHLKLQGRGTGRSMEMVGHLLYSQIFKTTGTGYNVFETAFEDLESEIEYFQKFVF